MYVELRERRPDGSERTVATFRWDGHLVTCDNAVVWNHLIQATGGVIVGERGRKYTPQDGEQFLSNLRFQYRGPYLWACEVDDGEQAEVAEEPPPAPTERAVVVPIPDDARELAESLDRAMFVLMVTWGSLEEEPALEALDTVTRLLEATAGVEMAEVFADADLRIKLQNARYGVTPPPVVPRLAAKGDREFQRLVTAVRRRDLREALVRAQLMSEYLRGLGSHRVRWAVEAGLEVPPARTCIGLRPGEPDAAWDDLDWMTAPDAADPLGFLEVAARRCSRALDRALESAPRGELYKAMLALRQAVSYHPLQNEGRTLLGEVLLRMEHPRAEPELRKALYLEVVRRTKTAPLPTRIRSLLREVRQHQALARCALIHGRVGEGRAALERALARMDEARELGGTGRDGALSDDEVRATSDRILSVLANLAREPGAGGGSAGSRGEEVPHVAGGTEAIGGRAEDAAGVPGALAGREQPDHAD